ncbi:pyrroloquinoline quinone-dependent dehydrogenase [Hansschlegelia plantiphila]|uniref:Alcohol dehydrogenase n=1 Tax=Hansschlegelia plantiphila TaxID=374655 RepID=A0A9W6IWR4_9HYPH|nr:PQQ-binding-like beta-propeller repeat protein [Hansschlegelia plantiphila]GLK66556.1 alcohol dehydrogenase [Hansschlegelia plantiphila]
MKRRVLSPTLLFALALVAAAPARSQPIDDARLLDADADAADWLLPGRDYRDRRFSPLDQIDVKTVRRLVPKWIYQTGYAATFQTTPLVADGVMYLSAPFSHVMALDAATGRELWRYEHKATTKKLCCGPANRGVALGYGKVFVATVDARLVALDQATGRVAFDIPLADAADPDGPSEDRAALGQSDPALKGAVSGSTGIGANSAPLVFDGKVIIGVTGVGYGLHLDSDRPGAPLGAVVGVAGRYGRPGFLAAFDAATGKLVWKFEATQEGWEGAFRQDTPYGVTLDRDIPAEKAAAEAHKDSWKYGGGSIWHAPALDPKTGLLFLGIGNPSPQAAGESRPGDNLYTSSLVALDARTGRLVWHYQQTPHDLWGYDVASPPALFDLAVNGKSVPVVGQASKLGWYFVHDRATGELLFKSDPFVPQSNMFKAPTPEGIVIAPGVGGGSNWSPAAVDPAAGVAFVAAMHWPSTYRASVLPAVGGKPAVHYFNIEPVKQGMYGLLSAIDLKAGGKILWQRKTPDPLVGGTLATAGGLVFNGEGGGDLSAFDAKTGATLWSFNCGAGVNAPPIAFAVAGKQYVAVAAGGSQIWGFRQGGAVIAFGLPD